MDYVKKFDLDEKTGIVTIVHDFTGDYKPMGILIEHDDKRAISALEEQSYRLQPNVTIVKNLQRGESKNETSNDLLIEFSPKIKNPIFILSPIYNESSAFSDLAYENLTEDGVTVKRGYAISMGGLSDFSWIAFGTENGI